MECGRYMFSVCVVFGLRVISLGGFRVVSFGWLFLQGVFFRKGKRTVLCAMLRYPSSVPALGRRWILLMLRVVFQFLSFSPSPWIHRPRLGNEVVFGIFYGRVRGGKD